MMPACRIPPPSSFLVRRALAIVSVVPASADPTGAPSPFEKHTETVSASAATSAGGRPVATAAFHRRDPSQWMRIPRGATNACSSARRSKGRAARGHSRSCSPRTPTPDGTSVGRSSRGATSGSHRDRAFPPRHGTCEVRRVPGTPGRPAHRRRDGRLRAQISSPETVWLKIPSWFAIVPVGT